MSRADSSKKSPMLRRSFATLAAVAAVGFSAPAAFAENTERLPEANGTYTSPDGDNITYSNTPGEAGKIRVCLSTPSNVTWWKSVEVYGNAGWPLGRVETQDDNHGANCTALATDQFDPNRSRVLLLKAKAFGVHTGIVSFLIEPETLDGRTLTFVWNRD